MSLFAEIRGRLHPILVTAAGDLRIPIADADAFETARRDAQPIYIAGRTVFADRVDREYQPGEARVVLMRWRP